MNFLVLLFISHNPTVLFPLLLSNPSSFSTLVTIIPNNPNLIPILINHSIKPTITVRPIIIITRSIIITRPTTIVRTIKFSLYWLLCSNNTIDH